MKIAFSGAQSSGKTTLIEDLKKNPKFQDFKFFTEITRSLKARGFSINEDGTDVTQIEIMAEHLRRLQDNSKDCVYDRCTLDGVVYTDYLYQKGKVSRETFAKAIDMFMTTVKEYDYIFYTQPNIPLEDDQVRSTSVEFRNAIIDTFDHYINEFNVPVISLQGSVEERLKTIEGVLNEVHRGRRHSIR